MNPCTMQCLVYCNEMRCGSDHKWVIEGKTAKRNKDTYVFIYFSSIVRRSYTISLILVGP